MKKLMLATMVTILIFQVSFFTNLPAARAEEMTCTPAPVVIDIKPGVYPNKIDLSSNGLLKVAILSTPDFIASQFTPEMAHLSDARMTTSCADAMAIRWNYDDVDEDGQLDLVFFFRIQDINLTSTSTDATLMTHGLYGSTIMHFAGTDSVLIKP